MKDISGWHKAWTRYVYNMGIPSYYKKLITVLPQLIKRSHPDTSIEWLFMDFNCLIYHCLHREDTPVFPGMDQQDVWEAQFIDCIVRYCLKIIRQAAPNTGVYLAIDGVVPMAKMRQQRLRRFKSVWTAQQEETLAPKWDTNAITPGTEFMKKLRIGLEKMIQEKGKRTWVLSSSDEPGEGEHKIMSAWRSGQYPGACAVYGLDADLIVLSLLGQLTTLKPVWLFREEVEKGKISYNSEGEELMEWFSIDALRDWITAGANDKRTFLLQYGFAMSILGNDFLPSSLGLKMREDGHTELLHLLREMEKKKIVIIDPSTQRIQLPGLQHLFQTLAVDEAKRLEKTIHKKQMFARSAIDIKLGENNWPLQRVEEEVLFESHTLAPDWKARYHTRFFPGHSIKRMVDEYLYGIQWIWAYYTGIMTDICYNWYYPFSLPPLWDWLQKASLPAFPQTVRVRAQDIRPVEQLAIVLPLESWHLIPPCRERQFPMMAPQFFPSEYHFESVGKRFFWECESMIPLPSIAELKMIIS
jgi:5'-3' exonuclease